MSTLLCPSLMCVDFSKLSHELRNLEEAGAGLFHIDVMDGHFVPNFALGPEDIKAVAKLATIPFDVHLMVTNPDPYIDRFADLGCSIIYVHAEACVHLHRTLTAIRKRGIEAGVVLNPGTPIGVLEEILDVTDVVMVMSVNPGFAGQPFIPASVDKVRRLKAMLKQHNANIRIAIDGAISPDVVGQLGADVDMFVLGTAGLFRPDKTYKEAIDILNQRVLTAKSTAAIA